MRRRTAAAKCSPDYGVSILETLEQLVNDVLYLRDDLHVVILLSVLHSSLFLGLRRSAHVNEQGPVPTVVAPGRNARGQERQTCGTRATFWEAGREGATKRETSTRRIGQTGEGGGLMEVNGSFREVWDLPKF